VNNLQQSLKLVTQEINMTEPLVAKGAAGQVEVIRLRRQASEIRGKIDDAINQYAVRAREEQVKNNADLDAELQVMAGKEDQVTRSELFSPVHGIVKDIQVSTVGGVLQPGGKLMEIVPIEDQLLIETRVNPRDIASPKLERERVGSSCASSCPLLTIEPSCTNSFWITPPSRESICWALVEGVTFPVPTVTSSSVAK